jgi:hypothetical protein
MTNYLTSWQAAGGPEQCGGLDSQLWAVSAEGKNSPHGRDQDCQVRGRPGARFRPLQMLEQQGVEVNWTPPPEERGLATDVTAVVINLVSTGSAVGIAAAVKQFRQRFPKAAAKVEGEPDDGGFLDG